MVKIVLDKITATNHDWWLYIPECSCNDASLMRLNFDHNSSIISLTKLINIESYFTCPSEPSVMFSEKVTLICGAKETNAYLNAIEHEEFCKSIYTEG